MDRVVEIDTAGREDYVHRGSALAAAEREPAEGGTRHFHLDHLGSAAVLEHVYVHSE